MTDVISTIVASDFHRTTLRAVAFAYRERRPASDGDLPAYRAELAAYRDRHPDVPDSQVAELLVGQMITTTISVDTEWFWRGSQAAISCGTTVYLWSARDGHVHRPTDSRLPRWP